MAEPGTPASPLARATLLGMGIGGAVFVAMGIYLNLATGSDPLSNLGPIAVFAVIGATVGGLVAPLFGRRGGAEEPPDESAEGGSGIGEPG